MKKLLLICTLSLALTIAGCNNSAGDKTPNQEEAVNTQQQTNTESEQRDLDIASSAEATSDCNQIKDSAVKEGCLNQVYFNEGTRTKNAKACNKITDENTKQVCISNANLPKES